MTPEIQIFSDVFNASPIGIAVENLEGQPLFVNPAFCAFLGFSEQELRSKHCVDFSPPEDAEKDWALFQQLRAGSIDHYQLEKRYFRRDGSLVWGSLSISLLNARPSPLVVAMVEDITEKRAAVDREHGLLEMMGSITKQMAAAVTRCSRDFRYLWVNQAYADWIQQPLNEVVDHSISDVLGKEAFDSLLPHFKRVLNGETVQYEQETNFEGIGQRWTSATYTPTFDADGATDGWVAVVLDVTDRKRAEQAVHESEQRFRLVADTAPVMIWMSGVDKKPTYFNQLWLDFTGFSETDLQNRFAELVHPEDNQQCHDVYCRGFDQRQPFRKECRLRRHDGQYRWMLDIGVPRFHKDGSFAGYIGSCIDVTEHKQAEEAISAMTRKLVEAQEQERARIGRELHDDINQRLAMLSLELEQLQNDPSDVQNHLQELRKRTSEISNDVQALSHDLHSSKLEYLGAVAGIKSWCNEFAERQKMEIACKTDVPDTLPLEIGRPLFRVLQEALYNASKHSDVKRVEVRLQEVSGEIHLTISDLGKGFDLEAALRGKGLGLTSMRERVRLMNGTISIESKPMGGTTIHVRIPLEPEHRAQRTAG